MDAKILFQLNESYRHGVYNQIDEEVLSEEELLDIQEWVEVLIDEGYDLDQYTDEELYEAYLDEGLGTVIRGLFAKKKNTTGTSKPQGRTAELRQKHGVTSRTGPESPRGKILDRMQARINADERKHGENSSAVKQSTADRNTMLRGGYSQYNMNDRRGSGNAARRRQAAIQHEEFDLYDLVSEYLVSEGFCDSYEDADVIMANMSEDWRDEIIEATVMSVTSPSGTKRTLNFAKAAPSKTLETPERLAAIRDIRQQKVDRRAPEIEKRLKRRYNIPINP